MYRSILDIPQDRWSGYSEERDRLLNYIASHGIDGIHILSGDFHFGFAIRAALYGPDGLDIPIWEFCSSPFEQSISTLAANTRVDIRNGLFKHQERVFKLNERNFGIVKILDDGDVIPGVEFELYNSNGDMVKNCSTVTQ
jgi:phosphodiesterase/alkaline phosphatase D-like protein